MKGIKENDLIYQILDVNSKEVIHRESISSLKTNTSSQKRKSDKTGCPIPSCRLSPTFKSNNLKKSPRLEKRFTEVQTSAKLQMHHQPSHFCIDSIVEQDESKE